LAGSGEPEEMELVELVKKDQRILSSLLDLHYLQAEAFSSPGNPAARELFNSPEGFLLLEGDVVLILPFLTKRNALSPRVKK